MATVAAAGGGRAISAGSMRLQSRTALLTVFLGIYLLLLASSYLESPWSDSFIYPVIKLSLATALVSQVTYIAIIYGIFVRSFLGEWKELQYALCAALACSMVFMPLSFFFIVTSLFSFHQHVRLWEMPRIGFTLLHMYLMNRLLKELRASNAIAPLTVSSAPSLQQSVPPMTPPSQPETPAPTPRPSTPEPTAQPAATTPPASPPATPPPPTPPATSPPHSSPPTPSPSPPPPSPPTRPSSTSGLPPPPPSPPPPPPSRAQESADSSS